MRPAISTLAKPPLARAAGMSLPLWSPSWEAPPWFIFRGQNPSNNYLLSQQIKSPGCPVPGKESRSSGKDRDSDESEWKGAILLMPQRCVCVWACTRETGRATHPTLCSIMHSRFHLFLHTDPAHLPPSASCCRSP